MKSVTECVVDIILTEQVKEPDGFVENPLFHMGIKALDSLSNKLSIHPERVNVSLLCMYIY